MLIAHDGSSGGQVMETAEITASSASSPNLLIIALTIVLILAVGWLMIEGRRTQNKKLITPKIMIISSLYLISLGLLIFQANLAIAVVSVNLGFIGLTYLIVAELLKPTKAIPKNKAKTKPAAK